MPGELRWSDVPVSASCHPRYLGRPTIGLRDDTGRTIAWCRLFTQPVPAHRAALSCPSRCRLETTGQAIQENVGSSTAFAIQRFDRPAITDGARAQRQRSPQLRVRLHPACIIIRRVQDSHCEEHVASNHYRVKNPIWAPTAQPSVSRPSEDTKYRPNDVRRIFPSSQKCAPISG